MSEALDTGVGEIDSAPADTGPSLEDTLAATYDRMNPPEGAAAEGQTRGPDGRFQSSDGAEPPTEAEAKAEDTPAAPVEEKPAEVAAAPAASPALPDYLAPYEVDFRMRGTPVEKAVPFLLDTWKNIDADPRGGIRWLAGRYGLTVAYGDEAQPQPSQQTQQPQQAADAEIWTDPVVAKLQAQVDELRAAHNSREAEIKAAREAEFQNASQRVKSEVEAFKASKAGDGIDFESLRTVMSSLIQSGAAQGLEDAYEMAVHANPTTRAAREGALRKQAEADALAKAKTEAEAARRAAAQNVRTSGAVAPKGRTMVETMSRVYDEMHGAG